MNRVTVAGKTYSYPRYNFTNASEDIRNLFTATCDALEIDWRPMNAQNISIAKRDAVSRVDSFVGPKR
jgi:single-stranded DNA-binding protein